MSLLIIFFPHAHRNGLKLLSPAAAAEAVCTFTDTRTHAPSAHPVVLYAHCVYTHGLITIM